LSTRLRGLFLVAEIALSLVLVIASGLLVRAFLRLLSVDPGFRAERVLTFELSLPARKYQDSDRVVRFYQSVLGSIRAIPGVNHAGVVETVPMGGAPDGSLIRLPGRPAVRGKEPFANYNIASTDYFAAAGTPLLRGRGFLASDTAASTPVVIVSAAMARKFWPGEEPIGKQVGIADMRYPVMKIIGVAADVKHVSLREETGPEMYVPFTQKPFPSMLVMHVVLRTNIDSAAAMAAVREEIRRLDAELPVGKVATLVNLLDQSLAVQRFSMWLITVFGMISLLLASIGLYGVISYSVLQRTREIGIRMALGARRSTVIAMVLAQGARLIGVGIAAGLLVAMSLTRLLSTILYNVPPTDWLTFSTAVPLLACVAIAACCVPALRASRVQPVTALRHE
jgi:putative ABC transport system permease protein